MKRYAPFLALLLIPAAWLLLARDSGESSAGGGGCLAGSEPGRPAVVALLGDEIVSTPRRAKLVGPHVVRLLRVSLPDGAVEAERELGPRVRSPKLGTPESAALIATGSVLAGGPGGRTVLALARQRTGAPQAVEVIDAATLKTRCRFPLERGVTYGGLTVGRSGRIYAYGFREDRRASSRNWVAGAAVVTTLDSAGGALIDTYMVRRPRKGRGPQRDWWPYSAAVSGDERRLVVTYHGGTTTGADWVDLSGDAGRRCASHPPRRACVFAVHGSVEAFGRGFVATTGKDMIELAADGRMVRRLPVKTRHDHLMDFALDADRSLLYVSRCGMRPVIRRVDLTRDRQSSLPSGRVCGAPLAVGGGMLVLNGGRVGRSGYPEGKLRLRLVDLEHPGDGVLVRRQGRPQDAVVVGRR
jgi:hypothetical protein